MKPDHKLKILQRLERSSAGPWVAMESNNPEDPYPFICQEGMGEVIARDVFVPEDALLIAHAPTDLRGLLDEVKRLEAALTDCRDAIQCAGEAMLAGILPESAEWLAAAQDIAIEVVGAAPADEDEDEDGAA